MITKMQIFFQKLLEELGTRVFYIEEVNQKGIDTCFKEAIETVTKYVSYPL